MKKDEIFETVYHIWNHMDQAGFDFNLKDLMRSAPVKDQLKFLEALLYGDDFDRKPDEELLEKARRLVKWEER